MLVCECLGCGMSCHLKVQLEMDLDRYGLETPDELF